MMVFFLFLPELGSGNTGLFRVCGGEFFCFYFVFFFCLVNLMFVFHRVQSFLDPFFWCSAVFTDFALSTIVYHDLFRQPLLCVGVFFMFILFSDASHLSLPALTRYLVPLSTVK